MLTIQNNTGIQENETAQALSLQLSPNPFNGATEVTLSVAEEGMVHLDVTETAGREILPPKSHTRGLVARPFDLGDQMEYIAAAFIYHR